jgi:7-cyano-7-deazaguanine reductase
VLETVPNPRPRDLYLVRFAAPEFTTPVRRDRPARLRPSGDRLRAARKLVESKSLKLYLGSFRNHAPSTRTAR